MRPYRAAIIALLLALAAGLRVAIAQEPPPADGRIAGRVIDRGTGRPLGGARITVVGRPVVVEADLDGRYRTGPLPPGVHALQAALIGYQPVRIDSVVVAAGAVALADFALQPVPFEMAAIAVEAQAVPRPSSDAGLLAIQQAAPTVSDGVSAEAMSRTPDSDAADAVARVTGISIVDDKFVVVRGLPERYSNTLLNGAELASPEPLRRVVPLDMFPASLLETIVTTKTTTPDRPGDFAGGSVELRTKDFPDAFSFQANTSQGFNSVATLERVALVPRNGLDWLGFDDGRRALPSGLPPAEELGPAAERFGESVRNVWTPRPRLVAPDAGVSLNVGGRTGSEARPLGYVLSWTYSNKTEVVPDRLYRLYSDPSADPEKSLVYQEARATVDWGGIANASVRLGAGSKLAWRNLYTRTVEEAVITAAGFETENARVVRDYQVAYVAQDFLQTQISGEHQLRLARSRLEWRATWARARRDEPDNRQVQYIFDDASGEFVQAAQVPTEMWARFLDDRLAAYQLDLAFPVSLRQPGDAELKVGALYRTKERGFDAYYFNFTINGSDPNAAAVSRLLPELAFAPENIGSAVLFRRRDARAQSYDADDRITAGYVMAAIPVLPRLRLVSGVRLEDWRIGVYPGGRGSVGEGVPALRHNPDLLWSANLTVALTDRMNLRFAGFRSVARPDAREMSEDSYVPVAGACENQGNSKLQRTAIMNGDVRWEVFPRPGELFSVSGFYKAFDQPIIEIVDNPGGGACRVKYNNGRRAVSAGVEIEVRRALDFLPGVLRGLFVGSNLTLVSSRITIDTAFGIFDPGVDLQGQSPVVVNANVGWSDAAAAVRATVLVNYFADRITHYGRLEGGRQGPDLVERGRATVDAKLHYRLGPHLTLSLAGRNLTGATVESVNRRGDVTAVAGRHRPGVGVSLGVGYNH